MECSPLAMAFKDTDMKVIPMPPRGTECERLPSPPPSDHSSQEDSEDDKKLDKEKKKIRMTREDYLEIRNRNVMNYLASLKENPPKRYEEGLAKLRKRRERRLRLLKGKAVVLPEVVKKSVDEEFGGTSESSRETNFSFPRNKERAHKQELQVQCYKSIVDQWKQQEQNGALVDGVLFSHVNFQKVLEAKWSLIKMQRLEQILEGAESGFHVDPKWVDFEAEIQHIYGPMDTESVHFEKLLEAFQTQRSEMITQMFEDERTMTEWILKGRKVPSELSQQLAGLREARSRLEAAMSAMSELRCDQNPYTNPDNMDFWVMPRPKRTIEVYEIQNEETDKFLEFNLPLDGTGVPQMAESKDRNQFFVTKGYNPAVFDVGWHYSPIKAFWNIPRQLLGNHSGNTGQKNQKKFDTEKWTSRFLEVRRDLMEFRPFGHEVDSFYKLVKNKYGIPENEAIFGDMVDQSFLVDLFFPQTLVSNCKGENKVILFDSQFEGTIVKPLEMLQRVWTRIRFLIEEQPSHLLPVDELPRIYEDHFGQKFFPLQWGFKDVDDFLQNVHKYLPKDITEDVTIVEKDERELEVDAARKVKSEADAAAARKARIDAKWAAVLGNDEEDDDEEDDELFRGFVEKDLFEELIHEGPWVSEGEVYRVLED